MKVKTDSSSSLRKTTRRRIPKWALHSNDSAANQQYYLRSIGRALEVLDCFDGKAPLALKEIGISTGLPESTLFRVLLTLEKHGYLKQAVDGTYQLAPKLRFGWLIEQANVLRDKVRPELERLTRRFNETVSMAYLYDDRIHVLDCIEIFTRFASPIASAACCRPIAVRWARPSPRFKTVPWQSRSSKSTACRAAPNSPSRIARACSMNSPRFAPLVSPAIVRNRSWEASAIALRSTPPKVPWSLPSASPLPLSA